jgi:hypothetical protein
MLHPKSRFSWLVKVKIRSRIPGNLFFFKCFALTKNPTLILPHTFTITQKTNHRILLKSYPQNTSNWGHRGPVLTQWFFSKTEDEIQFRIKTALMKIRKEEGKKKRA